MRSLRWVVPLLLLLVCAAPAQAVPPGWALGPAVGTGRDWHTATLMHDGSVLIAGGFANGTGATRAAERYISATNTWVPAGNMVYERRQHAAVLLDSGKVLVVGGRGPTGTILKTAETYDPGTNTWSAVEQLHVERFDATATRLPDGKIL